MVKSLVAAITVIALSPLTVLADETQNTSGTEPGASTTVQPIEPTVTKTKSTKPKTAQSHTKTTKPKSTHANKKTTKKAPVKTETKPAQPEMKPMAPAESAPGDSALETIDTTTTTTP